MLQSLRDGLSRRKWLAWVFLLPIAAIFTFWGGSNQLGNGNAGRDDAGVVDGEKIPASEAVEAWNETQKRWSQQYGTEVPVEQRARMQDDILDSLVMRRVIQRRMEAENFRVSEQRILSEIEKIPAFRNEQGHYDAARARQVLASSGITERELYAQTRNSLLMSQLESGLGISYFLMPADERRLFDLENEEREIEYVKFDAGQLAGNEAIDDAAIQKYYDENGDRFMTTESVALEYAELRLEQVATQVTPAESDLRKLYDENLDAYVLDERRSARHILITVDGGDDAAALKQAQSVLAEARAGKDFAELARKYSKDAGTAAAGGDLGPVQHRDIPGPAGDAIFSMKIGDIAGPVKATEGYHIIKLERIEEGKAKPFEEVRAEIDSQYRRDKAADLFGERQDQIAAMLEKGETDLDKIAQSLGLTRGSIPQFLRGGGAEPLGSSKELQDVVFDDATLNQGRVGGPVALGEDRLVLVKVTGHHKAEVKPLAEVRDQIVQLLRHDRGVEAAKSAAAALAQKLDGGEKLATLAPALKVSVEPARFIGRVDPSVPAALATAVFEAPRPAAKPVVRSATLDDGSTVVFVLTRTRVSDTSGNPQLVQQQNARLAQRSGSGDIAAYFNEARRKAKVTKNPKVFE
jgi:peptidyl-prolyl cis-trans isomerase D